MEFKEPPPWQEPPLFCLPGVPLPQTSWSPSAWYVVLCWRHHLFSCLVVALCNRRLITACLRDNSAVLIHGIDGTTYPQLGSLGSLPEFVDESKTSKFGYSPFKLAGERATEETILQVATDLLELLLNMTVSGATAQMEVGSSHSILLFAYDLGGTIVKEVNVRIIKTSSSRTCANNCSNYSRH